MNLTAFVALVRRDLRLFFMDKRAVLMSFVAPIVIASFFGYLFGPVSDNSGAVSKIAVTAVDQDQGEVARHVIAALASDPALDIKPRELSAAREAVRGGKTTVAVVLPSGFGDQAAKAFFRGTNKPEIQLLYDPSHGAEMQLVRGLLTQHVMEVVSAAAMSGTTGQNEVDSELKALAQGRTNMNASDSAALRRMLESVNAWNHRPQAAAPSGPSGAQAPQAGGFSMPYTVAQEPVTAHKGMPYNSMAHSFAGMCVQFILFMGIDAGMTVLMQRRTGLWKRLQAAPLSRFTIIGSRAASASIIAMTIMFAVFGFARVVFGVRIEGSFPGFLGVCAALALMTATFGLLLSVLGRTPEATRGIAILVTLLLVMLGGSWVPAFLFPRGCRRSVSRSQRAGRWMASTRCSGAVLASMRQSARSWLCWDLLLCSLRFRSGASAGIRTEPDCYLKFVLPARKPPQARVVPRRAPAPSKERVPVRRPRDRAEGLDAPSRSRLRCARHYDDARGLAASDFGATDVAIALIHRAGEVQRLRTASAFGVRNAVQTQALSRTIFAAREFQLHTVIAIVAHAIFQRMAAVVRVSIASGPAAIRIAPVAVTVVAVRVDLGRTHLAIIEIHGAGEMEAAFGSAVPDHVNRPHDPIVTAGLVIEASLTKLHCTASEAIDRLIANRVLTDLHGLVRGVTVHHAADHATDSGTVLALRLVRWAVITATPHNVECVALGAVIRIFNVYDRGPIAARFLREPLHTAAIHAREAEARRIHQAPARCIGSASTGEGCQFRSHCPDRRGSRRRQHRLLQLRSCICRLHHRRR